MQLLIFALAWAVGIYAVNCLIAREIKRISPAQAFMHAAAMALIGLAGEVTVGTLYHALFSKPLWAYTILPIHHSYTSRYALFLWGVYGFHLYLLHGTLAKSRPRSIHRIALLFSIEAVVIEALVNISYKLSFNNYIYYYFPNDLWHLTSLQTLPFYLGAGYIIAAAFRRFESDPRFFACMCAALACLLAFGT